MSWLFSRAMVKCIACYFVSFFPLLNTWTAHKRWNLMKTPYSAQGICQSEIKREGNCRSDKGTNAFFCCSVPVCLSVERGCILCVCVCMRGVRVYACDLVLCLSHGFGTFLTKAFAWTPTPIIFKSLIDGGSCRFSSAAVLTLPPVVYVLVQSSPL